MLCETLQSFLTPDMNSLQYRKQFNGLLKTPWKLGAVTSAADINP